MRGRVNEVSVTLWNQQLCRDLVIRDIVTTVL